MTRAWRGSTSARPKQDRSKVKREILEAFGSSLARVEMTYSEGKPIAAATAAGRRSRQGRTGRWLTRFAGGREYELSSTRPPSTARRPPPRSSRPCSPGSSKRPRSPIPPRGSRSSRPPIARPRHVRHAPTPTAAGTKLVLRTDLEPDVAKTELAQAQERPGQRPRPLVRADHELRRHRRRRDPHARLDRHVRKLAHHHRLSLVAVSLVHLRACRRAGRGARRLDHLGRDRRQLLAGQGPRLSAPCSRSINSRSTCRSSRPS